MNDEKIEQLFKRSLFELPTQGYLEQGEPKLYAFDELEAIYATATDNPLRNYLKTMLTNTNYVGTQPGFMDQFNWQTDAGKRKLITFGHKKSDEHVFYYTEITPRLFRKATVTKQRVTFNNGEIVRHKKSELIKPASYVLMPPVNIQQLETLIKSEHHSQWLLTRGIFRLFKENRIASAALDKFDAPLKGFRQGHRVLNFLPWLATRVVVQVIALIPKLFLAILSPLALLLDAAQLFTPKIFNATKNIVQNWQFKPIKAGWSSLQQTALENIGSTIRSATNSIITNLQSFNFNREKDLKIPEYRPTPVASRTGSVASITSQLSNYSAGSFQRSNEDINDSSVDSDQDIKAELTSITSKLEENDNTNICGPRG